MKFRSSPYRHSVAILGLLFASFLPVGNTQAISVTVENWSETILGFGLKTPDGELLAKGCFPRIQYSEGIPWSQSRTIELMGTFTDCNSVDLKILGDGVFDKEEPQPPTSLVNKGYGVWQIQGGKYNGRVTQDDILIVMHGPSWNIGMRDLYIQTNFSWVNLPGINLSMADLSKANFSRANLSEADLSGANLSGANLSEANLFKVNLYRADLYRADLSGANLIGVALLYQSNLSEANLSGADLFQADLMEANLSKANLSKANLSKANLRDALLFLANLSGANLSGANLSGAFLDEVITDSTTTCPDGSRGPCW